MANLAQTINVLQAVILTDEEKMILTPTYHVMEMYKVHQDATLIPVSVISGDYMSGDKKLAAVYASASVDKNGVTHLSLVNIDATKDQEITVKVAGPKNYKSVGGRILTSAKLQDHNTFDKPDAVKPVNFTGAKLASGTLTVKLPAHSVVMLELK
jgi:alpha-L-arabinofuranosidase